MRAYIDDNDEEDIKKKTIVAIIYWLPTMY